jgi:hypothetical protein
MATARTQSETASPQQGLPSPLGERARVRASSSTPQNHVVLFVRQRRTDDRGETMPYVCLGRAFYLGHRGGRPMGIEWELETAMPSGWYQENKRAAG